MGKASAGLFSVELDELSIGSCKNAVRAYIRSVGSKAQPIQKGKRARRLPDELLVAVRCAKRGKANCVALQWRDGAGELHIEVLSPAQSWPYLN